ncbi:MULTISPECIES: hypothetical protein [Thermomonospora]|uniref:Uncharacterized protein n=1 Tax=Thermomonospora cellulosilytica TaxID=1411118 RepID=A0A7W3RC73_9ACTN|nr:MULTISPECIES: hypothetical protein [Thermomonospora]MBA9007544.1 hypothetical protein [Thermomonospora cellulosilytica]
MRSKRRTAPRGTARERRRVPSLRELRARLRTEKAEARLLDTEIRIHTEAARIRDQVRSSA